MGHCIFFLLTVAWFALHIAAAAVTIDVGHLHHVEGTGFSTVIVLDCATIADGVILANVTASVGLSNCQITTSEVAAVSITGGLSNGAVVAITNSRISSTFSSSIQGTRIPAAIEIGGNGSLTDGCGIVLSNTSISVVSNATSTPSTAFLVHPRTIVGSNVKIQMTNETKIDIRCTNAEASHCDAVHFGQNLAVGDSFSLCVDGQTNIDSQSDVSASSAIAVANSSVVGDNATLSFSAVRATASGVSGTFVFALNPNVTFGQGAKFTFANECNFRASATAHKSSAVFVGADLGHGAAFSIDDSTMRGSAATFGTALAFVGAVLQPSTTISILNSRVLFLAAKNNTTPPSDDPWRNAGIFFDRRCKITSARIEIEGTLIKALAATLPAADATFAVLPDQFVLPSGNAQQFTKSRVLFSEVVLEGSMVATPFEIAGGAASSVVSAEAASVCLYHVVWDGTVQVVDVPAQLTQSCRAVVNVTAFAAEQHLLADNSSQNRTTSSEVSGGSSAGQNHDHGTITIPCDLVKRGVEFTNVTSSILISGCSIEGLKEDAVLFSTGLADGVSVTLRGVNVTALFPATPLVYVGAITLQGTTGSGSALVLESTAVDVSASRTGVSGVLIADAETGDGFTLSVRQSSAVTVNSSASSANGVFARRVVFGAKATVEIADSRVSVTTAGQTARAVHFRWTTAGEAFALALTRAAIRARGSRKVNALKMSSVSATSRSSLSISDSSLSAEGGLPIETVGLLNTVEFGAEHSMSIRQSSIVAQLNAESLTSSDTWAIGLSFKHQMGANSTLHISEGSTVSASMLNAASSSMSTSCSSFQVPIDGATLDAFAVAFQVGAAFGVGFHCVITDTTMTALSPNRSFAFIAENTTFPFSTFALTRTNVTFAVDANTASAGGFGFVGTTAFSPASLEIVDCNITASKTPTGESSSSVSTFVSDAAHYVLWPATIWSGLSVPNSRQVLQNVQLEGFDLMSSPFKVSDNATGAPAAIGSSVTLCAQGLTTDSSSGRAIEFPSELPRRCRAVIDVAKEAEPLAKSAVLRIDCARIKYGVTLANITQDVMVSHCVVKTVNEPAIIFAHGINPYIFAAIENCTVTSTFVGSAVSEVSPVTVQVLGEMGSTAELIFPLSSVKLESDWENAAAIRMNVAADRRFLFAIQQASITSSCSSNCFGIDIESGATFDLLSSFIFDRTSVVVTTRSAPSASALSIGTAEISERSRIVIKDSTFEATATINAFALRSQFGLSLGDQFSLTVQGSTLTSIAGRGATTVSFTGVNMNSSSSITFESSIVTANASEWTAIAIHLAPGLNRTSSQFAFAVTNCTVEANGGERTAAGVTVGRLSFEDRSSIRIVGSTVMAAASVAANAVTFANTVFHDSTIDVDQSFLGFKTKVNDATLPCGALTFTRAACAFDNTSLRIIDSSLSANPTYIVDGSSSQSTDSSFIMWPGTIASTSIASTSRQLLRNVQLIGLDKVAVPLNINNGNADRNANVSTFAPLCLRNVTTDGTTEAAVRATFFTVTCQRFINVTEMAKDRKPKPPSNTPDALRRSVRTMKLVIPPAESPHESTRDTRVASDHSKEEMPRREMPPGARPAHVLATPPLTSAPPTPKPKPTAKPNATPSPTPAPKLAPEKPKDKKPSGKKPQTKPSINEQPNRAIMPMPRYPFPMPRLPTPSTGDESPDFALSIPCDSFLSDDYVGVRLFDVTENVTIQNCDLKIDKFEALRVIGGLKAKSVEVSIIACTFRSVGADAVIRFNGGDFEDNTGILLINTTIIAEDLAFAAIYLESATTGAAFSFGLENTTISAACERSCVAVKWSGMTVGPGSLLELTKQSSLTTRSTTSTSAAVQLVRVTFGPRGFLVIDEGSTLVSEGVVAYALQMTLSSTFEDSCEVIIRDSNLTSSSWTDTAIRAETVSITNSQFGSNFTFAVEKSVVIASSKKSSSGIILSRGGTVTSDGFGFMIKDSVVSSTANESNAVAVTLDLDLADRAEIVIDSSSISSEVSFGGGATAFWGKHVRWSGCSLSVLRSTISFSAAESRPDPLTVQNAGLVWSPPSTFHDTQLVIEDSTFQFRPRFGQHQHQGSSRTEGAGSERVNGSFVQWPINISGTSLQVFKNVVFAELVEASNGSPVESTRPSSFATSLKVPAGGDVSGASVCFHRVFFESAVAESAPTRSSAKTRDDPASPQQRTTSTPGNYSVAALPSQFRPSNECEPTRTQTPTPTLSGKKTSSVTASVSKTLELPTPAPPTLRPAAVPAPAKDAANVAGGVASSVGGVVSPLTAVVAVRGAVMARASDCEAAAAPMPNWPTLAAPLSGMFPTDSWGVMGGDIGAVLGNGLVLVIPVALMLLVGEVVHLMTRRSIFESAAFVLKYGSDVLVTLTVALISPSVGASVAILAVAALGRPDLPVSGGSVTFAAIAVIFILVVCVLAVVLLLWGWRKAVNFESSRNSLDSINPENDDSILTSHDQELAGKNIADIADIIDDDSSENINVSRHIVAEGKPSPKRRIMSAKYAMTVALSSGEWRAKENLSTIEASAFHLWLAIVGDGRVPSNAQHVNTTTCSHPNDQSDDLLDFDMDLINGPRSQPLIVMPLGGGAGESRAPSRYGDGFQGRLDRCLAPWRYLWSYGGWWIALVELTVSVLHGVASGLARAGHCTAGPWLALVTQLVYVGILLTVPLAPIALWVVLFGVQFLQLCALVLGFFELGEGASNAIGDAADIIDVSLPFVMLLVPVIVAAARILRCMKKRREQRQAARRQAATTLEQPLFDLDFEDEMLSVEDLLPSKRRSEQEVKTQQQAQQATSAHADRENPRNQIRIDPLSASQQRQQQPQQDRRQDNANESMAIHHGVQQEQQQPPKPRVRMSPLTLPRAIDIETYPPPPPRPVVPPTPILSFSSASRQHALLSPTSMAGAAAGARSSFASPAPPSQLLSTQPSLAPSVNSSLPDRPDNASVDTCAPDDDRCGERRRSSSRRAKPSSSVASSMKERSPLSPTSLSTSGLVSSAAGASSMILLSPKRNSNSDSIPDVTKSHQDVTDKSSSAGRSTPYSCSSFSLGAGSDLTLPPAPHRVRAYDSFSSAGESVNGRMTAQRSKQAGGAGNGSRGSKGDGVDDDASTSTVDDSKSTSGLVRHDPYLMNAVPQRTGLGGHRVQAPQRWAVDPLAESAPPPARRVEEFLI